MVGSPGRVYREGVQVEGSGPIGGERAPRAAGLRVLHATPSFAPAYLYGGPMRSVEGLVTELARRGVDVRVLTTDANGADRLGMSSGWQTRRGVPVRYLHRWARPDLAPAFGWEVYREARRSDVAHIMSLFSTSSMVSLLAFQLAGKPVVLSPRGSLEPAALSIASTRKKRAWLRVFAPALRRATVFHATSDAEAASIARVLGPGARVRVVPNGTDLEPRAAAVRRQASAPPGPPVIGALGRIHPIKALDRLVEATAILAARGVDLELSLAGPFEDPAYLAALRRLADRGAAAGRVRFLGELGGDAKLDFLAHCRVLCLASHSESFGNVVVEALAALTPVVATRGTPWGELEARGAGRWVDGSPAALADALEPYLRDEALARGAGERGRALVEEKYTWEVVAEAMEEVYAEAVRLGG
jgi:glycosyltransferase involved in cell wall biosynthesis